jgi:hypothetical protein
MKVKALSFRQPWAELVLQGRKTLDLRTWSTRYRGPLAIYASQTVEKEACLRHGLEPDQLTTGAVIGLVDLIGVLELDQAAYAAQADQHLSGRHYQEPLFGWELTNPRPLADPVPTRGRLLLFDVDIPGYGETPDQELTQAVTQPAQPTASEVELLWGSALPFELRLVPEADPKTSQASYRLGIYQRKLEPLSAQQSLYRQPPELMERVVELGGVALRAVADQVLEALRENGYKATDLNPNRREPFALQEEWGVRLGLLFLAVKPVSKVSRIEVISAGIRQMTSEELYYWYSKCTSRAKAERAQKALRMLLADE